MTLIYTREAKSFLAPDDGLYRRGPAHQMIPYMVRVSNAIRASSHRGGAVKIAVAGIETHWGSILRELRPYFFQNIDHVIAAFPSTPVELPNADDLPHVHPAILCCLDLLVDFDRLVILLRSEPATDEITDRIFQCWNGLYRMTGHVQGLERRILNKKANGTP